MSPHADFRAPDAPLAVQASPAAFAVRFEHLSARRNSTVVLDDVCAVAPQGGNTVIIGPNGAGKTSLLLCLLGELPHSGIVRFAGKAHGKPRVGYVPQQMQAASGLPLTVTEFLALSLQRRPLWLGVGKEVRIQAAALLERVRAGHLGQRRLGRLSGGELRRVLLAAALARDPELLILDEPAAGVDFQGERLFWEVLDEVRRAQGFTQIMVSHNLPLAAHYATHLICLNKSIRAEGPPRVTLTTTTLLDLFGVPIHLYPDQCDTADQTCPQCGVYGPEHLPDDTAVAPALAPVFPPVAGKNSLHDDSEKNGGPQTAQALQTAHLTSAAQDVRNA